MTISFQGKSLEIDGNAIAMPWPVLDALEQGDKVFVLFDPDSYLLDPNYKKMRKQGAPAIRNLIALTKTGVILWEAEMPDPADYYYRIESRKPLVALSFSSYRCEIDLQSGRITGKQFLK
jgi:hypothetical protein